MRADKDFHTRKYTVLLPDDISGGPECRQDTSLADCVVTGREHAMLRAEASIRSLEQRTGKLAVDKVYLSGFCVNNDGRACITVRIHFYLCEPFLKVVK